MSTGDGILTVTGFARFEKLHAEYNKLQEQVVKLEANLKKVTAESKRGDDTQQKGMSSWVTNLAKVASGYVTLQAALRLVTKELEAHRRLMETGARADVSLGDAQRAAIGAFGPKATAAQVSQGFADIGRLAREVQMPLPAITTAFAKTFSATEGADMRDRTSRSIQAIKAAAPFFRDPNKLEELGDFTGAVLDLQKGVPGLSVKDANMIMFATLGQSRLTEVGSLKNLIPAAVAAQVAAPKSDQLRNTREALSLVAALGARMGEPSGEKATTAISNLPDVMKKYGGGLITEDMTIGDMINVIAANPEVASKVMENVKGRGPTKGPQREFFAKMLTYQKSKEILGELVVSEQEGADFLKRADAATPALQRSMQIRKYQAEETERLRQRYATAGTVRAMLFGGPLGDDFVAGGLVEGGQRFKGISSPSIAAARTLFDISTRYGMNPLEAARRAINVVSPGSEDNPQAQIFYNNLRESINSLPQPPAPVMEELKKQREVAEQQAVTTQNALQGANAAAQGKNQQE